MFITIQNAHVMHSDVLRACRTIYVGLVVEHQCRWNAYLFVSRNNVTPLPRMRPTVSCYRPAPAITIVAAIAEAWKHQRRPRVIRYYRAAFPRGADMSS